MNRVLQVLGATAMAAVVAVSMVACGGGDKPKTEAPAPAPVVEEVAEPVAEEAATDEATETAQEENGEANAAE